MQELPDEKRFSEAKTLGGDQATVETHLAGDRPSIGTGIDGLDTMLDGGIPEGNVVLLSGGPGTGKSTAALHFLHAGLTNGESCLYLSLEEEPEQIAGHAHHFGMDIDEPLADDRFRIIKPSMLEFDHIQDQLSDTVREMEADRVVIDSIAIFGGFYDNPMELKREIIELTTMATVQDTTVMLVTEVPFGSDSLSRYQVEEFACDGILYFHYNRTGSTFERAINVHKMRDSDHDKDVTPMEITDSGIRVHPAQDVGWDHWSH